MRPSEKIPDWHLRYRPDLDIYLYRPDDMGDANLGTHKAVGGDEADPSGIDAAQLPLWLTLADCANLVEWFEQTEMGRIIEIDQQSPALAVAWDEAAARASRSMNGRLSGDQLRTIWSGCLAAAKAISPRNYWIGPVGTWQRYLLFKCQIFPESRRNPCFRIGALAAPIFKLNRGEAITLKGVPLRTCGDPTFMRWESISGFER